MSGDLLYHNSAKYEYKIIPKDELMSTKVQYQILHGNKIITLLICWMKL